MTKVLTANIVATALAVLAYFGVLQKASSNGLEIAPAVFNHIALLAISITSMILAAYLSKQTFLQAWFVRRFEHGDASEKAQCLLLYPDAYNSFQFLRSSIGRPPLVFERATGWLQIVFALLMIVFLVTYLIGFVFLLGALTLNILNSTAVAQPVSIMTVVASAATLAIAFLSPRFSNRARVYTHYGLAGLVDRLEGEKRAAAHGRIARASLRMGLIVPE